jgi:deazaflavin-dependent oxidoreductase (nitroreductase family)
MTTTHPQDPGLRRVRRLALLGGPWTRPISGKRWLPLYGVLHHVGRTTGREYHSPVVVRSTAAATYVPLPFGERTDWYRNALAAGGVRTTWKGSDHWLADPRIIDRDDAADGFNHAMRGLMRLASIESVVRFDAIAPEAPGSP